jgi:hypothetical protein
MTKSRKGMQAIEIIIFVVIALVVLFVVLWIFKDQIGGAFKVFTSTSTKVGEMVEGVRCETLLKDKTCETPDSLGKCPESKKKVSPPTGKKWSDCTEPKICCEEVI